jgi:ATP-dependent Clp protease ATP-binding subunit ClpA
LDLGFDQVSGARPMARVIQEKIKIPLSEFILKSKHLAGTIKVDFCKNKNKFILQYDNKEEKKLTFSS